MRFKSLQSCLSALYTPASLGKAGFFRKTLLVGYTAIAKYFSFIDYLIGAV